VVNTARTQADIKGSTIHTGNGLLCRSAAILDRHRPARGKLLEIIGEIAHIRLPKPFCMLHCTA
jgi:hypothetical protein